MKISEVCQVRRDGHVRGLWEVCRDVPDRAPWEVHRGVRARVPWEVHRGVRARVPWEVCRDAPARDLRDLQGVWWGRRSCSVYVRRLCGSRRVYR